MGKFSCCARLCHMRCTPVLQHLPRLQTHSHCRCRCQPVARPACAVAGKSSCCAPAYRIRCTHGQCSGRALGTAAQLAASLLLHLHFGLGVVVKEIWEYCWHVFGGCLEVVLGGV